MSRKSYDFIVVGSGGGGGTIAWVLAKAGLRVLLLEQGARMEERIAADGLKGRASDPPGFDSAPHDEYYFRMKRPDPKRRPRGDYNTYRAGDDRRARPFKEGWTGSVLGGGSVLWGTWSYRALPVDFRLKTHFAKTKQLEELAGWGYSVADWPLAFKDMVPYYGLAEALMGVSGDRGELVKSIQSSDWFKWLSNEAHFNDKGIGDPAWWNTQDAYPMPAYPRTPVGHLVYEMLEAAKHSPCALPSAIVNPAGASYATRAGLVQAINRWRDSGSRVPAHWDVASDKLWSALQRSACNMCGYCGEYLCWGKEPPKFGTQATTLREFEALPAGDADLICNAKVFEITTATGSDGKIKATGVRWLDISDPEQPKERREQADHVVVSCGAVQSARLLHMSGPPGGLGNSSDHLGRHATFHLFGLTAKLVLKPDFQGFVHGEFGHTGNVTSFGPYFLRNAVSGKWIKCGTMTSTAKKNPAQNAWDAVGAELQSRRKQGIDLMKSVDEHARTLEIRVTADDLPMKRNRVDLDPQHVDEYGFPVARITRDLGPAEWQMYGLVETELQRIIKPFGNAFASTRISPAVVELIGDHQMSTCRMAARREDGVVNSVCSVFDAPNVFVVDSSFMPSGLGVNPMVTVVANALRVGTHLVSQLEAGKAPWLVPA